MKHLLSYFKLTPMDWGMILACSIPAFYMLGSPAIYIWDEAVYVNAALDMSQGSSWWVPVHGEYNTKPPFVLWLQALSLLIFPWPEWAVRVPSALAVTGILIMMAIALKRWGFGIHTRIAVMICFVAHEGFIRHHISRTGDLDAVMTFFSVMYLLVALDAIHQKRWTGKHLFLFFLAVTLAFYSKSIAGGLMLGPLLLVLLLSPVRGILLQMRFWLGAALTLSVCALYYLTRELLQPGFLDLVWHSEYQRIARNVMPWHEHGPGYYFKNFIALRTYTPWIFILAACVLYSLIFIKEKIVRTQLFYWIIIGLGYMLLITIPAVKLEWYDAPAYPVFALIMGVTFGIWISRIPGRWKFIILIPVVLLLWRKLDFINTDIHPRHPFEYEGSILRHTPPDIPVKIFMPVQHPEHRLQLEFYTKLREAKSGQATTILNTVDEITVGDKIIISQPDQLHLIQDRFVLDTLSHWDGLGHTIHVAEMREGG